MLKPPAQRSITEISASKSPTRCYRLATTAALAVISLASHSAATANLAISFVESAPKDRFVITNQGTCSLSSLLLEIDLSSSAGQLIFDTTAAGAGVEVYQPFEVRNGSLQLASGSVVNDGDKAMTVSIATIAAGDSVSFTIDVDDTLANSQLGNIRVAGSEIANTRINAIPAGAPPASASLGSNGKATITLNTCS